MVSVKSTLLAVTLAVGIQADYWIDPNTVPLATRRNWCQSELSTCPLICLDAAPQSGKPITNSCDPATLTYGCVCGNGLQPNVSEYSLTLPFFTCQQFQTNCVAACGLANNACSSSCFQDNPCGALSPKQVNTTSTTTAGTQATGTGTGTGTSSSGPQLATGFAGSSGSSSGNGQSLATHSTSIQTSLTLATVITGILIGPLLLL